MLLLCLYCGYFLEVYTGVRSFFMKARSSLIAVFSLNPFCFLQ